MVNDPANISEKVIDLEDWKASAKYKREVEDLLLPVAGDPVIGVLEGDLQSSFISVMVMTWTLDEYTNAFKDAIAEANFNVARASLDGASSEELMSIASDLKLFESDSEAHGFFHALALFEAAQKRLVFDIRELTGNFTHGYDVRHGFRVVRLAKRYR